LKTKFRNIVLLVLAVILLGEVVGRFLAPAAENII
jgi:hypothetical protein